MLSPAGRTRGHGVEALFALVHDKVEVGNPGFFPESPVRTSVSSRQLPPPPSSPSEKVLVPRVAVRNAREKRGRPGQKAPTAERKEAYAVLSHIATVNEVCPAHPPAWGPRPWAHFCRTQTEKVEVQVGDRGGRRSKDFGPRSHDGNLHRHSRGERDTHHTEEGVPCKGLEGDIPGSPQTEDNRDNRPEQGSHDTHHTAVDMMAGGEGPCTLRGNAPEEGALGPVMDPQGTVPEGHTDVQEASDEEPGILRNTVPEEGAHGPVLSPRDGVPRDHAAAGQTWCCLSCRERRNIGDRLGKKEIKGLY